MDRGNFSFFPSFLLFLHFFSLVSFLSFLIFYFLFFLSFLLCFFFAFLFVSLFLSFLHQSEFKIVSEVKWTGSLHTVESENFIFCEVSRKTGQEWVGRDNYESGGRFTRWQSPCPPWPAAGESILSSHSSLKILIRVTFSSFSNFHKFPAGYNEVNHVV